MRKIARVDGNHKACVDKLRKEGFLVLSLAQLGGGVPDLLVFDPDAEKLFLLEVKNLKATPKITEDQKEFHKLWPVHVVYTPEQCLKIVKKK